MSVSEKWVLVPHIVHTEQGGFSAETKLYVMLDRN